MARRVALLAPMSVELAALRKAVRLRDDPARSVRHGQVGGVEVVVAQIGIGPAPAAAETGRVLGLSHVDHVAVVGVAGAIARQLAIGDLVVPALVRDHDTGAEYVPADLPGVRRDGTLLTTATLLGAETLLPLVADGVVAVDMEAAGVAAVCAEAGVPWSVFRGISDVVGDAEVDERILRLTRPDGSADLGAVVRFVAGDPRRARTLARLGRQLSRATAAAARAAIAAIPAMARVSGG